MVSMGNNNHSISNFFYVKFNFEECFFDTFKMPFLKLHYKIVQSKQSEIKKSTQEMSDQNKAIKKRINCIEPNS